MRSNRDDFESRKQRMILSTKYEYKVIGADIRDYQDTDQLRGVHTRTVLKSEQQHKSAHLLDFDNFDLSA
jgi:hypothetical protein